MRICGPAKHVAAILGVYFFFNPLFTRGQPPPQRNAREAAVGIVLAGGGSFGAFEAGALQGFFEQWTSEHGSAPPVRVIAGTSTGALVAPFAALGPDDVGEIADLYRTVERKDVFARRLTVFLPFAFFSKWSSSVYGSEPLARLVKERLSDQRLTKLAAMWPETRVVVLGTDFASGQPAAYSNDPNDPVQGLERFRGGMLASASTPLTTPPVYMTNGTRTAQPHLDGGVSAVAPFQAFFDLAGKSPEITLTDIVVISPYAPYPSTDVGQSQRKPFPVKPNFAQIGARTGTLLAESSVSKELALVWAAISLRNAGFSREKVMERTGLNIGQRSVELILIAPDTRLGWDTLRFDQDEMQEMFTRGLQAKRRHLLP
jgi:predicted acylesterase/phospholipase RssA